MNLIQGKLDEAMIKFTLVFPDRSLISIWDRMIKIGAKASRYA